MKIYIDESNINLSKQNTEEKFFFSAAAIMHNDKMIEEVIKIKKKYDIKNEVKGSDLMTRKFTNMRKEVVKKIFPLIEGSFFICDYYAQKSLDITFEWNMNPLDIQRHILSSAMAESCKKELFELQQKNFLDNFDEKIFVQKIQKNIEKWNFRIPALKNNLSDILKNIQSYIPDNWIANVSDERYIVVSNLVINLFEIMNKNATLIFDEIENEKSKKCIIDVIDYGSQVTMSPAKFAYEFKDSNSSIGIQIADWIASMTRKTVHDLITLWYTRNKNAKESLSNIEIEYGNELLNIWSKLKKISEKQMHIQLTYQERAFLEWADRNNDITMIWNDDFESLLEKYLHLHIMHDMQNIINF